MFKPNKILFTFLLLAFILFLFCPKTALAEVEVVKPELRVEIGGKILTFGALQPCGEYWCIGWIGDYILVLYKYGVGLAAVLAAVMIMVGGFLWLTSAGSPDKVGKAKEFITGALTGLVLALFSFLILYTVNPRLTGLEPLKVKKLTEVEVAAADNSIMCCKVITSTADPQTAGVSTTHVNCTEFRGQGGVDSCKSELGGTPFAGSCWNVKGCPQYDTTPNAELLRNSTRQGVSYGPYVNTNGANNETLQNLGNYGQFDPVVNSWNRSDGTRHDPRQPGYVGNVVDIHYDPNDSLTPYITSGKPETLTGDWGQPAGETVTAYHMPDGSVWVQEPGGSTGYHWHVEFNAPGWTWRAAR